MDVCKQKCRADAPRGDLHAALERLYRLVRSAHSEQRPRELHADIDSQRFGLKTPLGNGKDTLVQLFVQRQSRENVDRGQVHVVRIDIGGELDSLFERGFGIGEAAAE